MSSDSKGRAFQKLICNLLLNLHPICIARFMHPIYTKSIHKYYLNYYTIYLEYGISEFNDIWNIKDALAYSAKYGNVIIVKWCLKNKADIQKRNALYWSAFYGQLKVVKLLLAAGANVDAHVIQAARLNGYLEIYQLFLDLKLTLCYIKN